MALRFEWDEEKAEINRRKHGLSFQTASRVFADPFAMSEPERTKDGEQRWQTIGLVDGKVVLLVAHTIVDEDRYTEVMRIISARPATPNERRRYEQSRAI